MAMTQSTNDLLRELPSIDTLLRTATALSLQPRIGAEHLGALARRITGELRHEILADRDVERSFADRDGSFSRHSLLEEAERRLAAIHQQESIRGLIHVINATGVILHTNLGRAPLSDAARNALLEAAGYCTLEYDPAVGSRGQRGVYAEELLTQLTGAEAALVVNNCASAALLILTVLAQDGETIVSRGELVEIGGDFRVPDVMSNSGTVMVEVGSTNRTRLDDYQRAINNNTRVLMRVHPSNYRIIGFTDSPTLSELASLAHESRLPLYEDAGSGVINDLGGCGISDEPIIRESIAAGADLVSFSGDKLLGGSQAGLIVGRREIVDRLRKHSMYRALRVDKLSLAALEATLDAHRRNALEEIPALRMLALAADEIEQRAKAFLNKLAGMSTLNSLTATIVDGQSAIGGGSGPNVHPPTVLIALKHKHLNAGDIEEKFRVGSPPVIARIAEDQVLLDL